MTHPPTTGNNHVPAIREENLGPHTIALNMGGVPTTTNFHHGSMGAGIRIPVDPALGMNALSTRTGRTAGWREETGGEPPGRLETLGTGVVLPMRTERDAIGVVQSIDCPQNAVATPLSRPNELKEEQGEVRAVLRDAPEPMRNQGRTCPTQRPDTLSLPLLPNGRTIHLPLPPGGTPPHRMIVFLPLRSPRVYRRPTPPLWNWTRAWSLYWALLTTGLA